LIAPNTTIAITKSRPKRVKGSGLVEDVANAHTAILCDRDALELAADQARALPSRARFASSLSQPLAPEGEQQDHHASPGTWLFPTM
jgi:hypothetical protein